MQPVLYIALDMCEGPVFGLLHWFLGLPLRIGADYDQFLVLCR